MRRFLRLFFSLMSAPAFLAAQEGIPRSFSPDRYDSLMKKSPFALATPAIPSRTETPSFAAHWSVTGIGSIGADYFVSIQSRDASVIFSLFGTEVDFRTGVRLESVQWTAVEGDCQVVLRKGNETATLHFSGSTMPQPSPVMAFADFTPKLPPRTWVVQPFVPNRESSPPRNELTSNTQFSHTPRMRLLPRQQ